MRASVPSLGLWLAFLAVPAFAAKPGILDDSSLPGSNRYERCLALGKSNPKAAQSAAEAWHSAGGGAAALHCAALALVSQHRYAEAATKLDQAAMSAHAAGRGPAADLYDQAGNAWLLAGQPQKAEISIDSALALAPDDEDLLFDRARARAAAKNWRAADSDLTELLQRDPDRADALVLRASARHAEGRRAEAGADVVRALDVYHDYPEALVERGDLKFDGGDRAGARADWQKAAHDAPDTDAGAAARAHLAGMDALSQDRQVK